MKRPKSKNLQRRRGELVERTFAHVCNTGGARRTRLRGRDNAAKRYLIQAAAANLGLVLRKALGVGTPRGWAALRAMLAFILVTVAVVIHSLKRACAAPWRLLTDTIRDVRNHHVAAHRHQLPTATGC